MSLFGPPSPPQNGGQSSKMKTQRSIETTWNFNEPPITEIDFKKVTPIYKQKLLDQHQIDKKTFNQYPDVDYIIAAENPEGPSEYKWSLHKVTTDDRVEHLSTQMGWRLSEGSGHAFYRIGVHDDGQCQGLSPKELQKTLHVFGKICHRAQAEKVRFYKVKLPNKKFVADIHIRKIQTQRANEMKTIMIGPEGAGKSTLIGCLSEGERDDGHGMSASFMLKHKHEFNTGRTSTADNFAFLGFENSGLALNNSNCADTEELYKRAEHLVTLIDVAGIAKYRQTLLHGISFTNPDTALIVIQASRKEEFLKDYVELLSRCYIKIIAVVLTHCNEQVACENENKKITSNVTRSKSEPNFVPLIYCDCKNGFGIERVQRIIFEEMEVRNALLSSEPSTGSQTPKQSKSQLHMQSQSKSKSSSKSSPSQSPKKLSRQKSSLNIFKILETYNVYSTNGTIVTGRVKSGEIKENDILTLGPINQDQNLGSDENLDQNSSVNGRTRNSTSACVASSSEVPESPTIISAKKRKRKSQPPGGLPTPSKIGRCRSNSFNNLGAAEDEPEPILNQVQIKILSIEKNRVRIASARSGELVSLKVIVVDEKIKSTEPIVVKRGAMIYNDPISNLEEASAQRESDFHFTNKITLKLVNNSYKIDLKQRTRLEIFYDTAKIIGNVKSDGWTTFKNLKYEDILLNSGSEPLHGNNGTSDVYKKSSFGHDGGPLTQRSASLNSLDEPITWTKEGLRSNALLLDCQDSDELIIQVELETYELIKYGDTCLISCLRNITDVTRCEFVRKIE